MAASLRRALILAAACQWFFVGVFIHTWFRTTAHRELVEVLYGVWLLSGWPLLAVAMAYWKSDPN